MDADVKVAIDQVDFGTDAMAPLQQFKTRIHLMEGCSAWTTCTPLSRAASSRA